jgi:hypothetical protein
MYPFGYLIPLELPEELGGGWIRVAIVSTASTLMDNLTRQISHGDKSMFGYAMLDYLRNESGNSSPDGFEDWLKSQGLIEEETKSKSKKRDRVPA